MPALYGFRENGFDPRLVLKGGMAQQTLDAELVKSSLMVATAIESWCQQAIERQNDARRDAVPLPAPGGE